MWKKEKCTWEFVWLISVFRLHFLELVFTLVFGACTLCKWEVDFMKGWLIECIHQKVKFDWCMLSLFFSFFYAYSFTCITNIISVRVDTDHRMYRQLWEQFVNFKFPLKIKYDFGIYYNVCIDAYVFRGWQSQYFKRKPIYVGVVYLLPSHIHDL